MNINKKILALLVVYIVAMVGFTGYKVSQGGNTYFNYKNEVKKAKTQLDSEKKDNKDSKTEDNSSKVEEKKGQDASNAAPAANSSTSQPAAATNTQKQNEYSNVKFSGKQLSKNAQGDEVKKLQSLLKDKECYTGEITGKFDEVTKQALIKFQKNNNLTPADGILGPDTIKKLEQ